MNEQKSFWSELSQETLRPLLDNQVLMVMGGGKGDEGKWGDAYALAMHGDYSLVIGPVWWPNAWHTVHADDWYKFVGHNLPGAALSNKPVFLGQGKFINISGLETEALELRKLTGNNSHISIAASAHVIIKSLHAVLDGWIEEQRSGKIGTTLSGMWPAVATRALRTGFNIGQLVSMSDTDVSKFACELVGPWNTSFDIKLDEVIAEIKYEKTKLSQLIRDWVVQIVGDNFAQQQFQLWNKMLVEWAQSPLLGMFGGAYPNNTSTDTNSLGILSSLGIRPIPWRVGELLVVKAFPSAVGTHEFPERVSHISPELLEAEKQFGIDTGELWATTGRPRMIAFPSPTLAGQQLNDNAPYTRWLSVRKLDMVPLFLQQVMKWAGIPVVTWYDKDGKPIIATRVKNAQELLEHYQTAIKQALPGDAITLIAWFGPAPKDSRVI